MKKLLISLPFSLGILLLPFVASAAYNDVSLGTSAIISINNSAGNPVSLTVSGTADVVESLVVGTSSFSVTLQSGSTLTVASASRNLITTDAPDVNEAITCGSSESSVALTATAQVTISVSVSANACGAAAGAASSTGGSNGPPAAQSGGGGGGSTYVTPVATTPAQTTTTSVTDLQAQITSLLAMVASLQAQLGIASGSTVGSGVSTFAKNMVAGNRSADVANLQKVLNSDPDTQVSISGAGSPGNETTYFGSATKKAIQKFQIKYGIAQPGGQGYGVFGPKTRAKANEIASLKGI